ncbi:MAG: hypothetical protein II584_03770 [Treponema sp.]|nr:hypothetical protein [Treponema sp.]
MIIRKEKTTAIPSKVRRPLCPSICEIVIIPPKKTYKPNTLYGNEAPSARGYAGKKQDVIVNT